MAQKSISLILTLYLAISLSACTTVENKVETPLNPNGDSELAILMREMFEDAERMKTDLAEGKKPTSTVDFEMILSAHATEPEKAASPEFKAYADAYITLMKDFESVDTTQQQLLYNNMVNTCMNCHNELCPGPTKRIKKLY